MRQSTSLFLISHLLPRLQDVIFISLLIAGASYGPRLFNMDGDLGRHITIGSYITENKTIPTRDIFSHTMRGESLVPHEWLAQVVFSIAHRLMGLNGVVLLTIAIIALTFTIAYREMIHRGSFRFAALAASLWAAAASSLHWLARPHIFTFLFLAIWAYQLERVVTGKTIRWGQFPLIMLVWANTHGAFIAGFVVWGAYTAEWMFETLHHRAEKSTGQKLALIGLASFAVTFINPSYQELWKTSVGYIGNRYLVDRTVEYMSPNFHLVSTWPFLLGLAFILFTHGMGRQMKLRESILLAGWAAMALYSARNIPLFAIVSAPILCNIIQSFMEKLPRAVSMDREITKTEKELRGVLPPIIAIAAVIIAFANGINLDPARSVNQYDPSVFPVNAANWLEENPQSGNVFNHFPWGGYLLYRVWPQTSVFIDGQTDFYGESLTREYEQVISTSPGWEDVFEKYHVEWAIIETKSDLAGELEVHQQWKVLYKDETAIILHK